MIKYDAVHITADNTNVFSGRLGERVPTWARRCRVQLIGSDSDWTFSLTMGKEEMARDSAPSRTMPLTELRADWNSPHFEYLVTRGSTDFEVLMNVNVVTAGEGLAIIQWES